MLLMDLEEYARRHGAGLIESIADNEAESLRASHIVPIFMITGWNCEFLQC